MKRISILVLSVFCIFSTRAQDVVHDAEYYILKAQYGDPWEKEDVEINKKLKVLKKKYGTPPNIVHIMWDDTPMGEVGFPAIQQQRGFKTPQINKLASEGINFTRMYTEPSCTQSRAAVITGRHPVRNGLVNVGFPYEYGGLASDEVTMAEVMSDAGYATAFFGKAHMGDIEESYMTRQGFDEAVWTPYNQYPVIYSPQAEIAGGVSPATVRPDIYPDDPYDKDKGWRVTDHVSALIGTKDGEVNELVRAGDLEGWYKMIEDNKGRTLNFIEKSHKNKKPFYVAYWPSMIAFVPYPERKTLSGGFLQEGLVRLVRLPLPGERN